MKTKTYDLNLYIIDGKFQLVAYELSVSSAGEMQTNFSNFRPALRIDLLRANRPLWEPILKFFDETEVYDELDSWYKCELFDSETPYWSYPSTELEPMPPVMQEILKNLPDYEIVSYA